MILDRCFSDFRHKYSIEELLEKVNDKLYDANGCASMIKERQLRGDFNAIRKMLPNDIYLEAIPYDGKNVTTVIQNLTSLYTRMNFQ